MLKIFYGRTNVDQGKYIFDSLEGDSLLLVPDQFTLQAERSAFFYTGKKGFMSDLDVISISRLGKRILSETGSDGRVKSLISMYGRYMLLSKIMYEKRDEFRAYARQSRMTSFVEMMNDFISEMKQNNRTPDDVLKIKEKQPEHSVLRNKLEDIHMVFSAYQEEISGMYTDTEDYIDAVLEKIPLSGLLSDKDVWVYGFDSLTEKNILMMGEIMKVSRNLNVVITCGTDDDERDIFRVTSDMVGKLAKKAFEEGIDCSKERIPSEYTVDAPSGIAHVERNLFSYPADVSDDSTGVTVVRASDLYNEAESAAAHVLGLVRDRGARYRDISVICNDTETRGSVIRRVFEEYGMDIFIDQKRSLMHNPAVRYVSILVLSAVDGLKTHELISLAKTGLTELTGPETEELENYAIKYRIKGNMWKQPFMKGRFEYEPEELLRINESRKKLTDPVLRFAEIFCEKACVSEKLRRIYGFLEDAGIPEKLSGLMDSQRESNFYDISGETCQAWNYIVAILDQIAALEGDEFLENDVLSEMMRTGFESIEVGVLPPNADGLILGTAQRIRNPGARHVVVIGANEGVFPLGMRNDGILNSMEKKHLFEADDGEEYYLCRSDEQMQREEKLAIYRNLTGKRESLYISFSASDIDGAELTVSPVCTQIKGMFPGLSEKRDINNAEDSSEQIQTERVLLRHIAGHINDGLFERILDKGDESDAWRSAICWLSDNDPDEIERLRRGLLYSSRYRNLRKEYVDRLYSGETEGLRVSPSALERFSRCPFSFLMTNGMKLKERRVFEIGGREIGDVYHSVLMNFSRRLTDSEIPSNDERSLWMKIDRAGSDRLSDEIIDSEIERYRDGLFRNGDEENYRTERLRKICRETCWMIIENIREGNVRSMLFEEAFGRGRRLRPVAVSAHSENVYIEGKIDRVDYSGDDRVRVVDYKTGSDSFSTDEAREGWKLQLMIYLKAASAAGKEIKRPAGVYYFTIKEPMADMSAVLRDNISGGVEKEVRKTLRLDGITVEETDRPGKNRMSPEDFDEFSEEIDKVIELLCARLSAGEIGPEPKRHGSISACTYCSYRGICRYE